MSLFHSFKHQLLDSSVFDFASLAGKVVLITNVASRWGKTKSHYKQMVELSNAYRGSNQFEIIGFPSSQFGGQEYTDPKKVLDFTANLGVTFPLMMPSDVNGPNTNQVYQYLKESSGSGDPTWNFNIYYLVGKDGQVIAGKKGASPKDFEADIKKLIS